MYQVNESISSEVYEFSIHFNYDNISFNSYDYIRINIYHKVFTPTRTHVFDQIQTAIISEIGNKKI